MKTFIKLCREIDKSSVLNYNAVAYWMKVKNFSGTKK